MTAPSRPRAGVPASSLEQRVEIETPEHVAFSYTVAGIGSRAAAAIVDQIIIGLSIVAIFMVVAFLFAMVTGGDIGKGFEAVFGSWAAAVMIFAMFALSWGYFVFFEALADGQTPGKKMFGLRVVQDGGYSISFGASAVRNIVRILDAQPGFFYVVGMVSAVFSRTSKRIGDHVAGTIVVHERVPEFAPAAVVTPDVARRDAALPVTALLTEDEYALLQRFMARRQALEPSKRAELTMQLAQRFASRMPDDGGSDAARIVRLYQSEQEARARGVASRGETGAAREHHALVARGAERWKEFAALLARARDGGLRALPEADIADFVARYREAAADLARLRTAARGRDTEALYYLSRLVAAGHNLLYRRREVALGTVWTFLSVTLPREARRSWRPILTAALLLFGPAAITYRAVVRNPELQYDLLPPGMIDRVENAAKNEERGKGYIAYDDTQRPMVSSFIMTNNMKVSFVAFAAGATAGVGTVLALVTNGVSIGAAVGTYQTHGVARIILGFVVAHGVLELSAICLAGGAGLLLAHAILLPGALTRREALVVQGRRAIRLATIATILLFFAGLIEGLFSADPFWPLPYRVMVGVVSGLLMILWLTRGWRGEADLPEEENAYAR
ncbi:MAG TPA: stage II sporulation protein M [Gemmatimonadaceae bacterium]